jgi:hypothetical protein
MLAAVLSIPLLYLVHKAVEAYLGKSEADKLREDAHS